MNDLKKILDAARRLEKENPFKGSSSYKNVARGILFSLGLRVEEFYEHAADGLRACEDWCTQMASFLHKKHDALELEAAEAVLSIKKELGAKIVGTPMGSIFYELLRDHISPSAMENILVHEKSFWERSGSTSVICTNGPLAEYAEHVARRVLDIEKKVLERSKSHA